MAAIRNRIYIGSLDDPDFYFENDSIMSANVVQNVALVGQELSIDTFTPVVMDDNTNLIEAYHFRSSDGQEIVDAVGEIYCIDIGEGLDVSPLIMTEHGTPVWYYQENTLIGKFYMKSVERVGRNQYQLNTVSAIGMLDEMEHGGGLFAGSTFAEVLRHILAKGLHGDGDPVIEYTIDEDLVSFPVSGWLPHDTKRNNLYQLIFANGINIVKNMSNGNPHFTLLHYTEEAAVEVNAEQIYDQGSVTYDRPYTNVVVMEHTYTPVLTESPVTLFDNTEGTAADETEIWFDNAPIIVGTLTTSGSLQIERDPVTLELRVSENSAVVSGNGVLTGIPYLHDVRKLNEGDSSASEEKTIRVENATLVNIINSDNLRLRLYAFYCPDNYIHKISNGIVYSDMKAMDGTILQGGQRCGKVYKIKDPYGKEEVAFLSSMNITASATNKADCEWYADYIPAGQEGLYQHVDVLVPYESDYDPETILYSGEWTVPSGVTKFRVKMISGGTGGSSGWPGENGNDAYTHVEVESTADLSAVWYGAEGGEGGNGGAGGTPGRVKEFEIENAVPGTVYQWTVGHGGEGGASTGFLPDTADELRDALENEHPDTEYTAQEIADMIATEQSLSGWSGSPNPGTAGTASTFSGTDAEVVEEWSTDDPDAYIPTGGVYEPINDEYYALKGNVGIKGGKGGARKVKSGDTFNWVTDGEDVTGDDGMVYRGGSTGRMLTDVAGLPEATGKLKAYGGNGAGAAVGIGRGFIDPETEQPFGMHINGGSDQWTYWDVVVDSEWVPPTPTPSPSPVPPPEPPPGAPALSATLEADKDSVRIGETITWTMTASGGNGEYSYFFTVYRDGSIVEQPGVWQQSPSCTWTVADYGKYSVAGYVTDSRDVEIVQASQGGQVEAPYIEPLPPYTTEGLYAKIGDRRSGQIVQLSSGVYGPMGEGTGVGPITPVKSNGEEIVIDSHYDFEINVVFKFESAFPDIPFLYPDIFNVWGKVVDEDPDRINPENEKWYLPHMDVTLNGFDTHGTISITASLISDLSSLYDGRKFLGIDVWQNVFGEWGTDLQLNAWYKMNFQKIGDNYYFVATKPDGSEYVGKVPNPHTLPLSFKGSAVAYFGSDSADEYSCKGVCYDLSQCYIKQSGRKIWGVPD